MGEKYCVAIGGVIVMGGGDIVGARLGPPMETNSPGANEGWGGKSNCVPGAAPMNCLGAIGLWMAIFCWIIVGGRGPPLPNPRLIAEVSPSGIATDWRRSSSLLRSGKTSSSSRRRRQNHHIAKMRPPTATRPATTRPITAPVLI